MSDYALRDAEPGDRAFLLEMLRLAVGWRLVPSADGSPLPVAISPYALDGFGRAGGDGGVVAVCEGEPVGACWWRRSGLTGDGPQLWIAVRPEHRAHGLGGRLLDHALTVAATAGHAAIALSVEADNPARAMYERRGFRCVERSGGSLTLRRPLGG